MKHWAAIKARWESDIAGPEFDDFDRDAFYLTKLHLDDKFHTYGLIVCDFCHGA